MPSLTRLDLQKLAQLAALDLSEEELDALRVDLAQILQYVAKLEALDTTGVEPLSQPTAGVARERPDTIRKQFEPDAVLSNAPEVMEQMFKVPPVLDGEEG